MTKRPAFGPEGEWTPSTLDERAEAELIALTADAVRAVGADAVRELVDKLTLKFAEQIEATTDPDHPTMQRLRELRRKQQTRFE